VLATAPVPGARLDVEPVGRHSIAVTAAAAARAIIVYALLDVTERAFALDHTTDCLLRLHAH